MVEFHQATIKSTSEKIRNLTNRIITQALGETERGQPKQKGGMVSTKQVLQVPLGGKQVLKGVHAYNEQICYFMVNLSYFH